MKVKPFRGVRPPKELVKEVASRPYDVLNSEEARKEAEGNEKSLYHIIKPEIDFPVGKMNTTRMCMQRRLKTSNCFRIRDGWCKMNRRCTMCMLKQ